MTVIEKPPVKPKADLGKYPGGLSKRDYDKLSILEKIKLDPKYARNRSVDWYKQKMKELGANSPTVKTDLINTTKSLQTNRLLPGAMHFFGYDPKYKEELPFYDMFPLTLVLNIEGKHFWGINFHYLGYNVRMKLYEKMYQIGYKSKLPTEQIMKLNWQLLGQAARFPEVRPAVKQYLFSHVKTKFIKIPVEDWATAIMLPVEKFAKKPFDQVARISTRKITGR